MELLLLRLVLQLLPELPCQSSVARRGPVQDLEQYRKLGVEEERASDLAFLTERGKWASSDSDFRIQLPVELDSTPVELQLAELPAEKEQLESVLRTRLAVACELECQEGMMELRLQYHRGLKMIES